MLPLALISNPPTRNPIAFTGPSITFSPFSPLSKVSLDFFGAGWSGEKKNPPDSVVFNVFTCEARRYHGCSPVDALAAAGEGCYPVETAAGWGRSGPWLSKHGSVRINPIEANFDDFAGERPSTAWAYLTLELIWATRQQDTYAFEHQPRLARPVVRINRDLFLDIYGRAEYKRSSVEAKLRAYERWKVATRRAGLERPDAYDFDHQPNSSYPEQIWFAFDLPLALDMIWMLLGDPHPLEQRRLGGDWGQGQARAEELLSAVPRIDPELAADVDEALRRASAWGDSEAPSLHELSPEQVRARAAAVRAGLDPDVVAPLGPGFPQYIQSIQRAGRGGSSDALYRARVAAVRPEFEARQRTLAASEARAYELATASAPEEVYETPLERYRREYASWRAGGGAGPQPDLPGGQIAVTPREREEFVEEAPFRMKAAPLVKPGIDPGHPWNKYVARKQAELGPVVPPPPVATIQAGVTRREGLDPTEAVRELYARIGNQFELARQLQTSQGLVNQWLTGRRRPMQRRTLTKIFALYSKLIRPVEIGPLPEGRSRYRTGTGRSEPSLESVVKLTRGVREWLIQQRDKYIPLSDEAVEQRANLKRGWIATQRKALYAKGAMPGRLTAWRRFRDFLKSVTPRTSISGVIPHFNPGSLGALIDPSRPRRRNRDSKWKTPPKTKDVPIDKFQWWGSPEAAEAADKRYKRFHSKRAGKVRIFQIPDGKKEVTRDPTLYVGLHETLEVPYQVPWASQKRGDDPENPITWFHEFPQASRPLEVLNPTTGVTSRLGGTYLVDDYYYS